MGMHWVKVLTIGLIFAFISMFVFVIAFFLGLLDSLVGIILVYGIILAIEFFLSPTIIKWVTNCKPADPRYHSELIRMVEDVSRRANLPKTPNIYIVEDPSPNAFAFGTTQGNSSVAFHTGILSILTRDELETVIAHEIGHIKNRDTMIMTIASLIPIIMYYAVYYFLVGRDDRRTIVTVIIGMIGAFIARLIGQLIVLYLSRLREFDADAFAKRITNKPAALASALAKISYLNLVSYRDAYGMNGSKSMMNAFYISTPNASDMFIAEQLASHMRSSGNYQIDPQTLLKMMEREQKSTGILELFYTHPPTYKRIRKLLENSYN
ncbi:MAG: M48 family metalloprotease [Candidatus Micrarchaeota archaeon]|nr:M48 family metalloprotease [Candidatus Micrarchaeota archaeon]